MRDETLDPRALSIPANSMAIYPAPTTATFLKKKKKNIYIYIYIYNNIISYKISKNARDERKEIL